jgi:hypothetical protein
MNTKRQQHLAPLRIIALFVTLISPAIGFVVRGQRQQLLQVRVVLSMFPQKTDRHINHDRPRWRTGAASAKNKSIGDTLVNSALPVVLTTINTLRKELVSLSTIQKSLVVTALVLGFGAGRTTPFWKRYTDVAEIPSTFFKKIARCEDMRFELVTAIRFVSCIDQWFGARDS